jgi:hypothetical protein
MAGVVGMEGGGTRDARIEGNENALAAKSGH